MFLLELKKFLRSKIAVTGLLFILIAGITSVHVGSQFLQKQKKSIEGTDVFQKEHIKRNVQYHPTEIGLLLYYLRFALVNQPGDLNPLSIGQRDVNSSIQSVTIRNLESQKYDTDLYNPTNLLLGNLDYSFVLVFLFPLLIIAFTYNILSEEKEGETWRLICIQAKSPLKMLMQKMLIRMGAVYLALAIILVYAVLILNLKFNGNLISLVVLSFLYLLFWFALSYWIMSWNKSSSVSAITLLTFWVLFTIVCPAVVNNILINRYPVPEALETAVENREGYHEKWDMDKETTMNSFYAAYPQFKRYALPDKQFSWLWYFAMQQMGDEDPKKQALDLKDKLWKREETGSMIAAFVPTLHTQQSLNYLAKSGLSNYLLFLDETSRFHENIRLYFYPKIFENAPVNDEKWGEWKVTFFEEKVAVDLIKMYLPLLLFISFLLVAGQVNLRKMM